MKIFKLLAIAFVAMLSFSSCEKECDHDFIMVDYSNDIVGTWTLIEPDHAAAYIFNADGTLSTTGLDGEEYWEDVKGTYSVVNNKITIKFESGRIIDGSFDIIPGQTISIVGEKGRHTYQYCKEDLSEEIVGMWVCNDGLTDGVTIMSYSDNGKVTMTTATALGTSDPLVNRESDYVVVGNLVFMELPASNEAGQPMYTAASMTYTPDATSAGDIMTHKKYIPLGDGLKESVMSFLRIKESLDLPGKKYDYIKTFVTNVKGDDKDIEFMGYTFNFAEMDGSKLDKMLKTILFAVEFTAEDTIRYSCHYNNEPMSMDAPIVVDGNKMTVKMSTKNAAYKDIDLYTFQDADCSQMHMYMPTYAFINFFGNMQLTIMEQLDQIDLTNETAVEGIFNNIDDVVETINVSFVMTKSSITKAL